MRLLSLFLIIFSITSAYQHQHQQQIIRLSNDIKLINKNSNITLKCPINEQNIIDGISAAAATNDDYLIKWFKNDENIKLFSNNNKNIKFNNNYLLIKNFNIYDIGVYKCQIINGNGIIRLFNVTLKINLTNNEINDFIFENKNDLNKIYSDENFDDDIIDDSLSSGETNEYYMRPGEEPSFIDLDSLVTKTFYKLEHSEIELNCNARGLPMPDIIWLKNNQIISEEDIGNTRNSMFLKIKNLNVHDSGNYTCQLTNEFGKINRTFVVSIYENLSFNGNEPVNQTVLFGTNVKFQCNIADNYNAQIMWLIRNPKQTSSSSTSINNNLSVEINGELFVYLNNDSNDKHIEIVNNNLIINQATYNDIGYYLCIINNSRGYNYRKAYLNVLPPLSPNSIIFSTITSSNTSSAPNISMITLLVIIASSLSAFIILGLFIYFCKNKANNLERKKTDKKLVIRCSNNTKLLNNQQKAQFQAQQQLIQNPQQQQQLLLIQQQQKFLHQQQQQQCNYFTRFNHHQQQQQQQQQQPYNTSTAASNSLRKSINSQRSSHINTTNTTNTNTNSTTVTKLNDLNIDMPAQTQPLMYQVNQLNEQMSNKYDYRLSNTSNTNNNNLTVMQDYDNYLNINQKLLQQQFIQQQYLQQQQQQQQTLLNSCDCDDDMIGWSDSSSNLSRPYAKIQYTKE